MLLSGLLNSADWSLFTRSTDRSVIGFTDHRFTLFTERFIDHWSGVCICWQDIQSSEDREMLARLAASTDNPGADSEAAIEKYLRSVLAVDNILTLDRLRQVWHTCAGLCLLYKCLNKNTNTLFFAVCTCHLSIFCEFRRFQ